MYVPECVDVPHEHAVPAETRRGHNLLDLGLQGSSEPSNVGAGNWNLVPLQEQQPHFLLSDSPAPVILFAFKYFPFLQFTNVMTY